MVSTRKLLKYIDKHPNCSYLDVAKDLFNNDIEITSSELLNHKSKLTLTPIWHIKDDGGSIKTFDNISINTIGKQELETIFKDKWRFRIPLIISIIALAFSIFCYFDEKTNLTNNVITMDKHDK